MSPARKAVGETIAQHSIERSPRRPRYTICVFASIFHCRSVLSVELERIRVAAREPRAEREPLRLVMSVSWP